MRTLRADAVVVGSGAGGAPVAARLAEAGREVLLLEAGPRLERRDFGDDEAAMTARLGRMLATADRRQNLYAGACVGGSTTVNDALCFRPPADVLEAWQRQRGLPDLAPAALAPFVERAWRDVHAEPTGPGQHGWNAELLARGAQRLGWAGGPVHRNVRGCARLGRCNWGCPTGAKQSTLESYVPRAEAAGARVLSQLRVERVRVEAGAATGVDALGLDPAPGAAAEPVRIEAPLVCVAAGVLGTPPLLLRSGVEAGADVQLHSSAVVTARFDQPVHGYYGPTMSYAIDEWSDVGGRDGPGFTIENTAVHPVVTATALPGFGEEHARSMEALPHLARALVLLRDRGRGRIELGDGGGPRVHYALGPGDRTRLARGLAAAARAFLAAGAREVYLPLHGHAPVRHPDALARLAAEPPDPRRFSFLYAVHLFGGACLAGSRAAGVCAPSGESWAVRGLYVSDASALPGNTGVNPQITILANALRTAEAMLAGGPAA